MAWGLTVFRIFLQGEIGEPGQKGSKGDKGEQVRTTRGLVQSC